MKHNRLRLSSAAALAILAASGFAQTAPDGTVKKEDVKTWVITSAAKEYEARPLTATFSGSTGLFYLPSAYTVAKGKTSFSLYRNNLDRNPKDLDASTIGVTLGLRHLRQGRDLRHLRRPAQRRRQGLPARLRE
jgi:hypothetical protein